MLSTEELLYCPVTVNGRYVFDMYVYVWVYLICICVGEIEKREVLGSKYHLRGTDIHHWFFSTERLEKYSGGQALP